MSAEQQQTTSTNAEEVVGSSAPSTHQPAASGLQENAEGDDPKVFFGNLSYNTTEEGLSKFVQEAGFQSASVELVKRYGNRSAGFAFVTFEKKEQAVQAVEKLDKKQLDERELTVQIKTAPAVSEEQRKEKLQAKRKAQKAKKAAQKGPEGSANMGTTLNDAEGVQEGGAAAGGAAGAAGEKKASKKKSKRPARRLPEEGEDAPADEAAATNAATTNGAPSKTSRRRKGGKTANAATTESGDNAEEARIDAALGDDEEHRRRKPAPKQPRLAPTGEPSKTMLFVANLPFSVDDAALAELFGGLGIQPKYAKVITKPSYSNKHPPRSKGFGFVEVNNEDEQKMALEKLAGKKIEEREITVTVGKERVPVEEQAAAAPSSSA